MSDLRDQIAAALRGHQPPHLSDELPGDEYECCADAALAVIRPELDQRDIEIQSLASTIAGLRADNARRRDHHDRMTELATDYVSVMAQDLRDQVAWAQQLYAAWWSARIGRAKARQKIKRMHRQLADANRDAALALTERDQLKTQVRLSDEIAERVRHDLEGQVADSIASVGIEWETNHTQGHLVAELSAHVSAGLEAARVELERLRLEYADAAGHWDAKRTDLLEERDAAVHDAVLRAEEAEAERDQLRLTSREYETSICFETTCTNCARSLDAMTRLEAERDQLRHALKLIGTDCEAFTGPSTCVDERSRRPDAEYSAERWCDHCIVRTALNRHESTPAPSLLPETPDTGTNNLPEQLDTTIQVLLLNHHQELLKPPGEQDPDIAELAHVYQQLTGWDPNEEIAQDLAALDQPTEAT